LYAHFIPPSIAPHPKKGFLYHVSAFYLFTASLKALPAQALVHPDAAAIFSIRSAFVMLLPPHKDIFDEHDFMEKK